MTRFAGGCQCGTVRYAFEAQCLVGYCCHCRECRKQSASAFGTTVPMLAERLEWSGATPQRWERPAHSGHTTACLFCAHCGTRVVHQDAVSPRYVSVKAGSIDDVDSLSLEIVGHLWVRRRLPGLTLSLSGSVFDTQPDDLGSWRASIVARMLAP